MSTTSNKIEGGYPRTPVPVKDVRIEGGFWGEKLRINREVTIPAQYEHCKATGRFEALKLNWKPGQPNEPHIFWDSDVAKWIEAASYSLAAHPDPELAAQVDEVVKLVVGAQAPDGYLNSHYTTVEPEKRWHNLRDCHELYCAGHLIEAAVAHYESTGKRDLMDALSRYADYIASYFGRGEGQVRGYCGHQEIELALVRLWRATGEERYLNLAKYFIDERGTQPHFFDLEREKTGEAIPHCHAGDNYAYMQADRPARELNQVTGHAVRAMYYYSAMTDLAAATSDEALHAALGRLWADLIGRRVYVTGGLGPSSRNEGFTAEYDLPNDTAYAETCAAIGLVFWTQRLTLLACDAHYSDILERALYNGVLASVSLDGTRYFYDNPLASHGGHERSEWFGCACCPPNLARLLASLGSYAYSTGPDEIDVHLYVQSSVRCRVGDGQVGLDVVTDYPWDGHVGIEVAPEAPRTFTLRLRRPGWCRGGHLSVGGEPVDAAIEHGYFTIEREWKAGDIVEIVFDMPVERVWADPHVAADRGRVALARGPLVYCLEAADNQGPIDLLTLPRESAIETRFDPGLLGGVAALYGSAKRQTSDPAGALYRHEPYPDEPAPFKAVPYYAWSNRGKGEMEVWVRETQEFYPALRPG